MNLEVKEPARPRSASKIGVKLIRIGVVYLVAGLLLGVAMGISHNFIFSSLHAHILLLGWATMVITGVVYIVLPRCEESWLARIHYWAFNLGLPTMIAGLAALTLGKDMGEKIIAPGAMITLLAVLAFAINVFQNSGRELPTR
jgi:hypothetical protein